MGRLVVIVGWAVGVLMVAPCAGQMKRIVPLQELVDRAQLVVVGEVASGSWSNDGGNATVTVRTERILAGDVKPGVEVSAVWKVPPPRRMPGRISTSKLPKAYGIWFMARSDLGTWTLVPRIEGYVPLDYAFFPISSAPVAEAYQYSPDAPVLDKVICELGAAAATADAIGGNFGPLFFAALRDVKSERLVSIYRLLAQSSSPNLRSLALAGLIERGDSRALVQFAAEAEDLVGASQVGMVSQAIEMFFRNPDPAAIAALGKLATSKSTIPNLQQAAVYGLRVIISRDALPFLVTLLDAPDSMVRYHALAGLASFANVGHVPLDERLRSKGQPTSDRGPFTTDATRENFPGLTVFQQDEARYIQFWKAWWAANQGKIREQ